MNEATMREAICAALRSVAPESNPESLDAGASFREELDLDSMDFLNFVIALHKALNVDIPEADYSKIQTMQEMTRYLGAKLPAAR